MFKNINYVHKLMVVVFNVTENVATTLNTVMLLEIDLLKHFDELVYHSKLAETLIVSNVKAYLHPTDIDWFNNVDHLSDYHEIKHIIVSVESAYLRGDRKNRVRITACFPTERMELSFHRDDQGDSITCFKKCFTRREDGSSFANIPEHVTFREYLFELEKVINELIKE